MARPTDWSPLAGADPVPGDPQRISEEAAHLASTAQEIQDQVARLRAIASGHSVEKGLHVDKLKSASSDVADNLDKVVGRYQKTSVALSAWVPELEYAQSQSLKALTQAQDAAARQRANQPIPRPSNYQPTPQDTQQDQQRQTALNQANSDLAAARQMLNNATSYRDQKGSDTRNKIENAINDGVHDSWWDKFKGFISQYASWIANICTVLEILALVLAVICLFIPGLNIVDALLLAGFFLTLAATVGRGVLAATGNGSWLDFGLDVLALLTFGASKIFSGLLKAGAEGAVNEGKGLLAAQYIEKFFGPYAGKTIGMARALEWTTQFAEEDLPKLFTEGGDLGKFAKILAAVKAGGGLEDWTNFGKIGAMFGKFGDASASITSAMNLASHAITGLRVAAGLSFGSALAALFGGGGAISGPNGEVWRIPHIPVISDFWDWIEKGTTTDGGLATSQAGFLVNLSPITPLGPGAFVFRWALGGGW
jgi:hypothetical protein